MSSSSNVRHIGSWTVISIDGELDIVSAPRVREQLVDLITSGHHCLVVDLDALTFIDSTGLGVLIGALKRVRAVNGDMRVVATVEPVVSTMRITGLHRVFHPYRSVDEAVAVATAKPALNGA